jgi:hypothetical protein
MSKVADSQTTQNGARSNKRLFVLGAILVGVFVLWIVTMIIGSGLGLRR